MTRGTRLTFGPISSVHTVIQKMHRVGADTPRLRKTGRGKLTDYDQLTQDISCCKEECLSQFRSDEELYLQCSIDALRNEKLLVSAPTKKSSCSSRVLKILWIIFLFLLGFSLVAVGFKPVAFHIHKVR